MNTLVADEATLAESQHIRRLETRDSLPSGSEGAEIRRRRDFGAETLDEVSLPRARGANKAPASDNAPDCCFRDSRGEKLNVSARDKAAADPRDEQKERSCRTSSEGAQMNS